MNRLFLVAAVSVAAISCSRPSSYYEFDGCPPYEFNVPFDEPDACYDSFLAFRLEEAAEGDSIPVQITVISPAGRIGAESFTFRPAHLSNVSPEAEFPYRSGIRVAQDTGVWRIAVTVDTIGCKSVNGVGFRYEKRKR